jgi:hypothetical protein
LAAIVKSTDKALSGDALAALNRLLLLELISEGDKDPLSGNIYLETGWHSDGFPIGPEATVQPQHLVEAVCSKFDPARLELLMAEAVPGLVEITPTCDIVQNRAVYTRLLTCLFVPVRFSDGQGVSLRRGEANERLGKLALSTTPLSKMKGIYSLVVMAIPVVGITMQKLRSCQPAFRLRKQAVVEIQTWLP